jgi:hypothetical protein
MFGCRWQLGPWTVGFAIRSRVSDADVAQARTTRGLPVKAFQRALPCVRVTNSKGV